MRLQQIEIGQTKTKDMAIFASRCRSGSNLDGRPAGGDLEAYYRLTNARRQIESYVYDVVRSTVPKINLDDIFTTKEEISHAISSSLKEGSALHPCSRASLSLARRLSPPLSLA